MPRVDSQNAAHSGSRQQHLLDRPLTLIRHPRGIAAKGFFQKNVAKHYPEELIGRIEMPRRAGVTAHPAITTADGLAYLASQARRAKGPRSLSGECLELTLR